MNNENGNGPESPADLKWSQGAKNLREENNIYNVVGTSTDDTTTTRTPTRGLQTSGTTVGQHTSGTSEDDTVEKSDKRAGRNTTGKSEGIKLPLKSNPKSQRKSNIAVIDLVLGGQVRRASVAGYFYKEEITNRGSQKRSNHVKGSRTPQSLLWKKR